LRKIAAMATIGPDPSEGERQKRQRRSYPQRDGVLAAMQVVQS
jgi:hypothetical protein